MHGINNVKPINAAYFENHIEKKRQNIWAKGEVFVCVLNQALHTASSWLTFLKINAKAYESVPLHLLKCCMKRVL
jgi:hypothetical protein